MKKDILSANPYIPVEHGATVSFKMFIDFINEKLLTEKGNRKYFYKYIHDKFHQFPELYNDISIDKIGDYEDVLQLVSYCIVPVLEDENEKLWAFGKTFSPHFFYGSDSFYKMLNQIKISGKNEVFVNKEEAMRIHKELQYSFIFEKLFNIKTLANKEWIHSMIDQETGLYRYYRLSIDRRFSWLETKGDLSGINDRSVEACSSVDEAMKKMEEKIPVDLFEGKGFTIMSLTDVTAQQALEQMAKVSVDDEESKALISLRHINRLLQTIAGSNAFQFGIMPFLTVNQRAAVLYEKYPFSIIAKSCWSSGIATASFTSFIKGLQYSPGMRTYKEDAKNDSFTDEIQSAFKKDGIKYYMCYPAYYNGQLVGLLEMSSMQEEAQLKEQQLTALKPAMHIIARLLQQIVNKFDRRIEGIVKDKFTNIQPAVQWKFNEVAWHYFRSNFLDNKKEAIENVAFNDVYPLYGAVDIRNSTIERNIALREDLKTQINLLIETLADIHDPSYQEKIADIVHECNKWVHEATAFVSVDEETRLNEFLRTNAYPLLEELRQTSNQVSEKISHYYAAIDEGIGIVFHNRRELEMSMQQINNAVSHFFDEAKENLQNIYPSYFDKFRTDGVEYDIYVGQSIAPKISFTKQHLQQFRFWQVQSMASIALLTNSLLAQMSRHLQTTQLLFVHSKSIDINFRNDERRFDVEGTYNIRYQVIKKRIDKVHIRGTNERLTQPGKIAIVYSNSEDADEYVDYIHQLQQQNILDDDLEYLELEELQGVSGLHAMRVGVAGI